METQEQAEQTPKTTAFTREKLGRRGFLKRAGVMGAALPIAGGLVVSACYDDPTGGKSEGLMFRTPEPDPNATPAPTKPAAGPSGHTWQEMDAKHKQGIEAFLENAKAPITKGKGGELLPFKMDGNVKVFELTVDEVPAWETVPGKTEKARGYNGTLPGPLIRVTEGDIVRFNVKNNLDGESTSIHWHGLRVPNNMDGVGMLTQDAIPPGQTYTYQFPIRNAGSHMYHSHHNSMDQVNRGLLGAFIVDPKDPAKFPKYDKEYILIMNDTMLGFTINGKGFPATEMLTAKLGERVLVRWMNEGLMNHPMHLHGMPFDVVAIDGYPLASPYTCDNVDIVPGNRVDTIITCDEVGVWAFHCHVLSHVENASGFFGLTTVLVVTE
jgi:manganese oxidase